MVNRDGKDKKWADSFFGFWLAEILIGKSVGARGATMVGLVFLNGNFGSSLQVPNSVASGSDSRITNGKFNDRRILAQNNKNVTHVILNQNHTAVLSFPSFLIDDCYRYPLSRRFHREGN